MTKTKDILSENFAKRLDSLNEKQKQAVETIEGPLMVVAGPGSGKTELLSIRTANILRETQVPPQSVLLLTFTESASYNMRDRLVSLIGETGYRVSVYTFHSFAGDVISRYPEYFFDGAKFSAATDIQQVFIIQNILENLPRKNKLTTYHPEEGYIYESSILGSISNLKKTGLDPKDFRNKLETNKKTFLEINGVISKLENSFNSISGKRKYDEVLPTYVELYKNLESLNCDKKYLGNLLSSLSLAINLAAESEKTTPITKWKDEFIVKSADENGDIVFILKDSQSERQEKLFDLAEVYERYQAELYKNSLYDFDDMILQVQNSLRENVNLRYDLQEKYQYIMIDEFQDTNDAQFGLVKNLSLDSDGNLNEQINLMVVGDDDQAIYKFQGAEINNIVEFTKTYLSSKVIVLDKNYRSTQDILDFARKVIVKAEDRLETRDKNIFKDIQAANKKYLDSKPGEIVEKSFDSQIEEFEFIASEIKNLLENKKVDPKEISVICRKHASLQEFSTVMNAYKLPYSYEKRENVLDKKHIKEIITIIKFANLQNAGLGEELLPEILSFDFWQIDKIEIWKIAEKVKLGLEDEDEFGKKVYKKTSWLSVMISGDNPKIKNIAEFLIEISIESKSTPLEYLIDKIIGTTEHLWEEDEKADIFEILQAKNKSKFISPYREYYFSGELFERNKPLYLEFLFSLRTFIGSLREFMQGQVLYAWDVQKFLDVYEGANSLSLSVVSPFSSSLDAVSLLTAHKAKGLEFEYVFLLSADDDVWAGRGYSSKISFPRNLQVAPDSDNDDDKIRLLFVALTRSKHTLYITNHKQKLRYLINPENSENRKEAEISKKEKVVSDESIESLYIIKKRDFIDDEKVLLKRLLENYKMPVTHLNNFLNFTRVGPMKFVEQNLLRFPQAMAAPAVYGSAMHETIEKVFLYQNKYQELPNFEFLKDNFENSLSRGRLPEVEFQKYLESGIENLGIYYTDLQKRGIHSNTKVEVKFSQENVFIDNVHITGNIDKMEISANEITVTDLKTGKSFRSFDEAGLDDAEKIKLHFYKYQLGFYALLLENSRSYNSYKIKTGKIEFLEKDNFGKINIAELEITDELKNRIKLLSTAVYNKIMNLDFPDTEKYKPTLKGILEFEDDLLSLNI